MSGSSGVETTRFALTAADGTRLAATYYSGSAPARHRIVLAGATSVPQGFYRRFAEFAADRGCGVVTFDYRGIALSAPETLRGFRADFIDWGRLDTAAAVDDLSDRGRHPVHLVGHSFGGQSIGFLPDPTPIRSMYTFGTGAGWHGWMPPAERLRVLALWNVVGPAVTAVAGYLPGSRLGLGEDLPLGAYRQWRRWCRYPRYFFDDPDMAGRLAGFAALDLPIIAATATDDRWASPASRDALMAGYSAAACTAVDIAPAQFGLGHIGHMGYFRAGSETLWQRVIDHIEHVGD